MAKKVSVNVPEINLQNITPKIMVVGLIVMAFVIGMLFEKVQIFEGKGGVAPSVTGTPVAGASTAPSVNINEAGGVGHLPVKGSPDAKVTLIEFADFRCPFCEQFFSQTESQIIKNYVDTGKVKYAFRNYAFLGPASVVAANAAECANDQGKFWDMHEYLFKNQPSESDTSMYNTDTLTKAATSLGLNAAKFRTCLDAKTFDAKVQQDFVDGQKAGVTGTPAFFVNGTLISGAQPYSTFQQAIDAALK